MKAKERMDLALWAADQAKKKGAKDAAVGISNQREIEVEHRDGQVDKLKESVQSSLSLSVYVDGRYSAHSTNDLRKESLQGFIEEAVAMTRFLTEDPFRALPDPKYYEGRSDADLKVADGGYASLDSAGRVRMAKEVEEAARAVSDKIISATAGYGDSYAESVRVHTNGFAGERVSTMFSAGAEVSVRDPGGGLPEDWFYASVRRHGELPDAKTLGETAAARALAKIGQGKIASGKYDMLVENRSAPYVLSGLTGAMSGRALQQKSSFLDGMLGKGVAGELLTLIDDPFVPGGLASRHYDSDGISAKRRVMIEKGVLKSYYIDNYYGRKLGWEPTTGSHSNVTLELGSRPLSGCLGEVKKGILINSFLGGNNNSTTGDFSYGVMGMLIEEGKIVKPINEMNVSGNMKALWQRLAAVGNDPNPYSSWRVPSLLFTDVEFSGV